MDETKAVIKAIDQKLTQHQKKLIEVNQNISSNRTNISALNDLKKLPDKRKTAWNLANQKVVDAKNKLATEFGDTERKNKVKAYESNVTKLLSIIKMSCVASKEAMKLNVDKCVNELIKASYTKALDTVSAELAGVREAMVGLQHIRQVAIRERQAAQLEYENCSEQIVEMKNKVGEEGYKMIYEKVLEQCGPLTFPAPNGSAPALNSLGRRIPDAYTIDQIETEIEKLTVEIDNSIENPELMRRYQRVKVDLEKELLELAQISHSADSVINGLTARIAAWEVLVIQVIDKLDILFKKFMQELSYNGEV